MLVLHAYYLHCYTRTTAARDSPATYAQPTLGKCVKEYDAADLLIM